MPVPAPAEAVAARARARRPSSPAGTRLAHDPSSSRPGPGPTAMGVRRRWEVDVKGLCAGSKSSYSLPMYCS